MFAENLQNMHTCIPDCSNNNSYLDYKLLQKLSKSGLT